jgi:hypothetical protein
MTGEVVYFFAFDVANDVLADRVGVVLGQRPRPLELRLRHAAPKDVSFRRPWVVVPPLDVRRAGQLVRPQVHLFEVGVISVMMRVAFEVTDLIALEALHDLALDDGRTLDQVASDLAATAYRDLGPALARPSPPAEPERYTAFCVNDLDGRTDLGQWLDEERTRAAALLSGLAPDRLSDRYVADVLRQQWSLEKTDLVVIDWDAALVVDLVGPSDDVLYVLEVANLQLEEFRMMDRTLDRYLNRAYEDLERRGAVTLFGSTSAVLRQLRWFRMDLAKLAEEVTNITKFVGDWYLARVYVGVGERFHLDRWRNSVENKLGQLDELYSVVREEVFERRLLWLELLMAGFFAIDVIAILWGRR